MKKIVSLMLILIVCAFCFAGCSASGGGTNNDAKTPEKLIIGSWKGVESGEEITYTFKADGKFTTDYASGTYTISGNNITLVTNVSGQEIKLFDNVAFSIKDDTLTIGESTYKKQ